MATNLGSTGLTWNVGNMKPESNDQTDALWGQNIADNTSSAYWGYADARRTVGTSIVGELCYEEKDFISSGAVLRNDSYNTCKTQSLSFYKKPDFNTLIGNFTGTVNRESIPGGGDFTGTSYLFLNGGTVHKWGTEADSGETWVKSESFSYDISGFTDNNMYKLWFDYEITSLPSAGGLIFTNLNYDVFCTE